MTMSHFVFKHTGIAVMLSPGSIGYVLCGCASCGHVALPCLSMSHLFPAPQPDGNIGYSMQHELCHTGSSMARSLRMYRY